MIFCVLYLSIELNFLLCNYIFKFFGCCVWCLCLGFVYINSFLNIFLLRDVCGIIFLIVFLIKVVGFLIINFLVGVLVRFDL